MRNKRINKSKKSKQVNKYVNAIKKQKGITLISLVVTIIVLLILAGVSINAVFSDEGIIKKAQEAQEKMNEAVQKDMESINELTNLLDSYMNESDSNGGNSDEDNTADENETQSQWSQSKTIVTNGTITYEVGDDYTYDVGITDGYTGGWKVLGAEDGKLLIITAEEIGTLTLEGIDGWNNGITYLNDFCKEKCGKNARSINVEDVNRITEYDPLNQGDGTVAGAEGWGEYGNKVTYSPNGSKASNGLTNENSINSYIHTDGRTFDTNSEITVISSAYWYYLTTLTANSEGTVYGLEKTSQAYQFLLPNSDSYWLASTSISASYDVACFDVRGVNSEGFVLSYYTYLSSGYTLETTRGVRAVVSI